MKGLTIIFALTLSFIANAGSVRPQDLVAIKLKSNEVIRNLTLKESTKILKSLDNDENIEIRRRVIYPEEVTQLITGKLTKKGISGKRPNPEDYN